MSRFDDPSLQIWFIIAAFGAVLIALGIASTLIVLRQFLRPRSARPHR
jgi:cytochrome o ubiquinol oxidase subunit 1